jgi:hypothetical protein
MFAIWNQPAREDQVAKTRRVLRESGLNEQAVAAIAIVIALLVVMFQ